MFHFKYRISKFNKLMAAITFAEADEREMAMEVMGRESRQKKQKRTVSRIKQVNTRPDMRV